MNNKAGWTKIGRLVRLTRYPLKGAGGEDESEVKVGWHGLAGDRRHALLRCGDVTGLPWISPRDFPEITAWRTEQSDPSLLRIILPGGTKWEVKTRNLASREEFNAFASELLGVSVSLVSLWRGTFDSMAMSIVATSTIDSVAALVQDDDFDLQRLRSNIIIELIDSRSNIEQKWIGRELRLGDSPDSPVVRIDRTTTRCEVLDVNPLTGEIDRTIFDAVRDQWRNRMGVYGSTKHPGIARQDGVVFIR